MPKKTNEEVITCNDPTIKGEKTIQIALNKEQRACLLDIIVCSKPKQKYKCLLPVIDQLEQCVKKDDPEQFEKICLKYFVTSKCSCS